MIGDGRLYLTMEHCGGRTLEAVLQDRDLTLSEALGIALAIAEAVGNGHRMGILGLGGENRVEKEYKNRR